jgi:hypothetical protein
MDRIFDIDDYGNFAHFDADDPTYDEFIGKKYKEYRQYVKDFKAMGDDGPTARKKAAEASGYGEGLKKLIKKGTAAVKDAVEDANEPKDPALDSPQAGVGDPITMGSPNNPGASESGAGAGGGLKQFGSNIPTPVLIGLGVVAAYFAYKKLA